MREKIGICKVRLQDRHKIHSWIDFSKSLVLPLGRRGQHDGHSGLGFQGAEKGGSAYPLYLVSGKEEGSWRSWVFHGDPDHQHLARFV